MCILDFLEFQTKLTELHELSVGEMVTDDGIRKCNGFGCRFILCDPKSVGIWPDMQS